MTVGRETRSVSRRMRRKTRAYPFEQTLAYERSRRDISRPTALPGLMLPEPRGWSSRAVSRLHELTISVVIVIDDLQCGALIVGECFSELKGTADDRVVAGFDTDQVRAGADVIG